MSIISNASYKIFSREEFKAFRKLNGNSQWNYDFGYKVIIQFYGKHHGYTSATDAITALVVDFKNTKIREFSKNLKWAKGQLKFGTIKEEEFSRLKELTKSINKFLVNKNSGKYAIRKMYSDIEKTKRRCYNLHNMIEDEMHLQNIDSDYKDYISLVDSLYSNVKKVYEYRDEIKVLIENSSLFLKSNSSLLSKTAELDIESMNIANQNLKKIMKWIKKPNYLYQDQQREDIKTFKDDLKYFEKLVEKQKQIELQEEKESNFEDTGYLETNLQRKEREDKLLNEFNIFKSLIDKCKKIQQIPEIKLINIHLWEKINRSLDALSEYTNEDYQNDKIGCDDSVKKLLGDLEDIQVQVLKPYNEIQRFLRNPSESLLIIKGMAGTGKTECINKIIQYYCQINSDKDKKSLLKNIIVSSPTTVGAANIRQRGFFNAQTLDYFLNKWSEEQDFELFIVDEASMLTRKHLSKINKKFNKQNSVKFVFIGDDGQFRPYDFDKGAESDSFALNLDYSQEIFGKGREIILENDFRIQAHFSNEYYDFLSSLRKENVKSPLETLNKVLKNTNDIEVVQESNLVVKFFNTKVHIGSSVRERLMTDSSEEVLYYLNKKDEFKEMQFSETEALEGIELYRGQKTRRPELGELYAQYYPTVKERLSKKNNLNTIISLFRSNVKADVSNILIRPHIFGDKFEHDRPILKGEVMFIKQHKNSDNKGYLIKTELGVGDSFIVTNNPQPVNFTSLDSSKFKNEIEDKVWVLEVKPILKFSKGKLGTLLLNIMPEAFKLDTRRIVVWVGDLVELKNDNEELLEESDLNKIYQNVVDEIVELELDPDLNTSGITSEDLAKIARVKYDYARVSFASQGGEWDNVIIQLEDTWDEPRFLYTSFTRAIKKNYVFN